ncbi:Wzz/FepE/Etk N-terminal domain-containing protein [Gammaproteobacteria bacterium]|nr:Wzz/FepE/Etk N-terminal domain-containing protein [Gammaproteobacteria bacterium]
MKELFAVFVKGKWIILSITIFISMLGVVYSLSLPNIYKSEALVVSSTPTNNSNIIRNYAGLANISGISLPPQSNESNSSQAFEKIKSLSFFESNFMPNIFLPDLMAYDSWNSSLNKSIYNDSIYDSQNNSWVHKTLRKQSEPSSQRSFNVFIAKHLEIYTDKDTNFINISVAHKNPYIAQEWNKILIDQINYYYRGKDRKEAEAASDYLSNILLETKLFEVKQVIAALLQKETQKLTLIESNEFYVYEIIDPPAVMETKSGPNRALICILIFIFGFALSSSIVLAKYYIFSERK